MYAKVFEQIFDSSIAEDWQVRVVFEDFLKLCDKDGVVDKTVEAIARRTNVPIDIIRHAIQVLEQPDPRSRRKDHDGRRIILVDEHRDWGWIIVNYAYYRALASEEQRRATTRDRVRHFREKIKKEDVEAEAYAEGKALPRVSLALHDQKIKGKAEKPPFLRKPTLEEVQAYIQERGSAVDPALFHAHYEANGWVQGNRGKPVKNWKACVITWERSSFEKSGPAKSPAKSGPTDYSKGF